jgi:signal transduction histidine kinase
MDARQATPTLATLRQARAQQKKVQHWLRAGAPALLVVLAFTTFKAHPLPGSSGRGLVVSIALGGFIVGLLGIWATLRRGGVAETVFVAVLVASGVVLMWAQPAGPGSIGVLLGMLVVARRLPGQAGVALSVITLVVLALIDGIGGRGPGVALLGVLGGLFGMVCLAHRLGVTNQQAEWLVVELERSRAAEAEAAGLAERQRLAREMHDVLAHSLSGLLLQLEGARMLAEDQRVDGRLADTIKRAHHLARSGLEEARRAIGLLRDDDLPSPERLAELTARFEADHDVPCYFVVSGQSRRLGSETRLAVYRVAQEALTNIAKHARPERVDVCLTYQADRIHLSVEDSSVTTVVPPSPVELVGPAGYGLTGMRERAELLGGMLTAVPTCHGFRVEMEVPG